MKRYIKTSEGSWPTADEWSSLDEYYDEDFEEALNEMWQEYLSGPEDEVNQEFHIFAEPSGQGMIASMFLFDDDGVYDSVEVDFGEWCNAEIAMAASSKSAAEYKKKYRAWIQELIADREKLED